MKEEEFNFDLVNHLLEMYDFEELSASQKVMAIQVFGTRESYAIARANFSKIEESVKMDALDLTPDPGILMRLHNTLDAKSDRSGPVSGRSFLPGLGSFMIGKFTGLKVGVVALFCWGMLSLETGTHGMFPGYGSDTASIEGKVWRDSCVIDSSSLLP